MGTESLRSARMRLASNGHALLLFFVPLLAVSARAQNQLWLEQFGSAGIDVPRAAARSTNGSLIIGGSTSGALAGPSSGANDAWIGLLDAQGHQQWIRQFGTNDEDHARTVAEDSSGGGYIAGETWGNLGSSSAGGVDAWIARYDSAGTQLWIRQIGTTGNDYAFGTASDGLGGVFVAGHTSGSLAAPNAGAFDIWAAHFDSNGNQIWVRQFGTNASEEVYGSTSDSEGGLLLTGFTAGSLGGPFAGVSDAWLARLDPIGNTSWLRQLGTIQEETGRSICSDVSGNVYVGGTTGGLLGAQSSGATDAWLARYDAGGNQVWLTQYGTTGDEYPLALASDDAGGVYVTGATSGALGGPLLGSYDAWVERRSTSGTRLWIQQLGTTGIDEAEAAVGDGVGGVYLCGYTTGSLGGPQTGAGDGWCARFDSCSAWTYCVGAINSTGQGGSIGHQGSLSVGENDFVLTAASCPPGKVGLFFFGLYQTQVAFGDGWLCVTGNQQRLPPSVIISPTGSAVCALDFTNPLSAASSITPGAALNFQFWYRDPQPVGSGYNLTNGLFAMFCQ